MKSLRKSSKLQSLEFTQIKLDEDLKSVKKDIKKIKSEIKELKKDLLDPNLVSDKFIELQDRSRMWNFELMELLNNQMKLWKNTKIKSWK